MQINGIAHIQLTVNNFEKSRDFYRKLLPYFEMIPIYDVENCFYCVGGRTGIAITPATNKYKDDSFEQTRVGLHHFCFRLRSKEDVDLLHEHLLQMNAKIVHPPEEGPWAPRYYSILFEDPDGIRIEANFVPGKGNLDSNVDLKTIIEKLRVMGKLPGTSSS